MNRTVDRVQARLEKTARTLEVAKIAHTKWGRFATCLLHDLEKASGLRRPSKMHGIMASAPEDTDLYQIVQSNKVGTAIAPGDLSKMQKAIEYCADGNGEISNMGLRARALAESKFSRLRSVSDFAELLGEFVDGTPTTAVSESSKSAESERPQRARAEDHFRSPDAEEIPQNG